MKFRVFAEGASSSYDDEGSHYLVREDGVLEVFTADGRKLTYSPTAWSHVDHSLPDPAAGASAYNGDDLRD
jgi:hypothetical protein